MKTVTMPQWVLLTFIQRFMARYHRSPTSLEIAWGCASSGGMVTRHLISLRAVHALTWRIVDRQRVYELLGGAVVVRP